MFPKADADLWDPRNIESYPNKIDEVVNAGFFDDSVRPILDRGLAELIEGSV